MVNRADWKLWIAGLALLAPTMALGGDQSIVSATEPASATEWGLRVDSLVQKGELQLTSADADPDLDGFRFLRYRQLIRGVPVLGDRTVVRQIDAQGTTRSVLATLVEDTGLDVRPTITPDRAMRLAEADMGRNADAAGQAELVLLPLDDSLRLTYSLWCWTADPYDVQRYFVDAHTGQVALKFSGLTSAGYIGSGMGTWGDSKKLSVSRSGSTYLTTDALRPAQTITHDAAKVQFGSLVSKPSQWPSYVASDADNTWTNGAVVDGHAYFGWVYDYYYRVHGFQGIDGKNRLVQVFIDAFDEANAFYDSFHTVFAFGAAGSPPGQPSFGPFASALDIVAHEYTHAITSFTWDRVDFYYGQTGALNEAFSDIMGTAIEFAFEPVGDGRQRAEWWVGEDVYPTFNPANGRCRSLADPSSVAVPGTSWGYPDNMKWYWYTDWDNGGVHINNMIVSHAYYLLVAGGRNRTSGIQVTGLGLANREKAEKIFFRGLTEHAPSRSTFYGAAAATYVAAKDLYGENSNEVAQLLRAWQAVGVIQ